MVRKIEGTCENCGKHKATVIWTGENGPIAMSREYMQKLWCECCCLQAQVEYAEQAATRLVSLKEQLNQVECLPL